MGVPLSSLKSAVNIKNYDEEISFAVRETANSRRTTEAYE